MELEGEEEKGIDSRFQKRSSSWGQRWITAEPSAAGDPMENWKLIDQLLQRVSKGSQGSRDLGELGCCSASNAGG